MYDNHTIDTADNTLRLSSGFTQIPRIARLELSVYELALYTNLADTVGTSNKPCFKSQETLAIECGMSRMQVRRCQQSLEAKGYIKVAVTPRRTSPNHITLVPLEEYNQAYIDPSATDEWCKHVIQCLADGKPLVTESDKLVTESDKVVTESYKQPAQLVTESYTNNNHSSFNKNQEEESSNDNDHDDDFYSFGSMNDIKSAWSDYLTHDGTDKVKLWVAGQSETAQKHKMQQTVNKLAKHWHDAQLPITDIGAFCTYYRETTNSNASFKCEQHFENFKAYQVEQIERRKQRIEDINNPSFFIVPRAGGDPVKMRIDDLKNNPEIWNTHYTINHMNKEDLRYLGVTREQVSMDSPPPPSRLAASTDNSESTKPQKLDKSLIPAFAVAFGTSSIDELPF